MEALLGQLTMMPNERFVLSSKMGGGMTANSQGMPHHTLCLPATPHWTLSMEQIQCCDPFPIC